MPMASIAVAMVLAVYMPPQAPGPGQLLRTISLRSSSVMRSYTFSPYDWKADTMSSWGNFSVQPARIVPGEGGLGWVRPLARVRAVEATSVHHERGPVQAAHGDEAARHVFIAA